MSDLNSWSYFSSTVYQIDRTDFINDINKIADDYVLAIKKTNPINELYPVYLTENFKEDPAAAEFCKFIGGTAWAILNSQGYDMKNYDIWIQDLWIQEHYKFSGQEKHVHGYGSQLSGFYFLQCPENSSKVIIHDPRPAKEYADLPEADINDLTSATKMINFTPVVGQFMFMNSWLPHSFTRHSNKKPFRFAHFNINIIRNNGSAPSQIPEAIVV